ncbi:transposase domain-containing protein [Streptomyces sp. NPDC056987]|uniref:transposase domain-containing protein n=1 Tax=Streptomyces sp. NPDC056987 TaxID=3345988 RepID=UPI00362BAC2C
MPEPDKVVRRQRLSDRVAVGVLTQAFPRSLVDDVLAETGRVQQRNRLLPARLVVYSFWRCACSRGRAMSRSPGC